jgi:glycosylphosphatidylinositol transamidase (GPIT) subunit GPI8
MEKIFENNIEKFIVKERMSYIDDVLNKKEYNIYYEEVLNFLENTTINLKNKKIKLTKEFIEDNKEKLIKNIKTLTSLIIEIESD